MITESSDIKLNLAGHNNSQPRFRNVFEKPYFKKIGRLLYRLWRLLAEICVVIMTLAMIWLYILSWLLTQQSINVSGARNNIGLLFADTVAGAGVDIPSMRLDWYPATDDIVFTGENISIKSDDGVEIQKLETLKSFFPLKDVRQAIVVPRKVQLRGGVVSWIEDEKGRIRAGLGTPETLGRLGPLWEGQRATERRSAELNLDGVKYVDIQGATAFYINEINGLNLSLNKASLKFEAVDDKLFFDLGGNLKQAREGNQTPISLSVKTNRIFQNFDVSFNTTQLNPSDAGPSKGRYKQLRDLNAPIDLSGAFIFNRQSGLQAAELNIDVSEGNMNVPFQTKPYTFDQLRFVADLDPGAAVMEISQFSFLSDKLQFSSQGALSELGKISDGDINSSPLFSLELEDLKFDMRPIFSNEVGLKSLDMSGRIDVDDRTLEVETLTLDRFTHQLAANLFVKLNPVGELIEIKSQGEMSGVMTAPELLEFWPVKFADGARRWIDRSVLAGNINRLSFDVDFLDEGEGLSEKALIMDFVVSEGTVQYISTMTPMTNVEGVGRIENNALMASISKGNIGAVQLQPSQADIPRLRPKGGDMILSVNASGQAADLLSLVNQKPFQFADRYGVNPQDVGGQGQIRLGITRPLLEFFDRDRILYDVKGNFTDATAPFQIGSNRVTQGNVNMTANREGLKAEGVANIGPWRTNIKWEETFDQGLTPTRYHVFGDMDHTILDEFGVGGREFFDGVIGIDIRATGKGLALEGGDLIADFKDTEITIGDYWTKQKGVSGNMSASLKRSEAGMNVEAINIDAPGLEISGDVSFTPNFALQNLSLNRISISDVIKGRLNIRPDNRREILSASFMGETLDISTLIDNSLSDQTSTFDVPIIFSGGVDQLILDPLYTAENASFLYSHNGEAMTSVRLAGDTPEGRLNINLTTDDEVGKRKVAIELPSAGAATQAFLGVNSLKDGRVTITGTLPLPGEDGPYIGDLIVEDFTLMDAPVLAQLLSIGSLKGLFDTLSGEGLGFERMEMPFQLLGGVLSVRDGYVYGPALGMTGEGNINLTDQSVDLDGAIAPAYTTNSLLGDIPLIGDVFGGKKGEGVLALSYTVTGPFDSMQVAVNPLSAITPGFMRDIFRKEREDISRQEKVQERKNETGDKPEFENTPLDNE